MEIRSHPPPQRSHAGGHEDCWSEGATKILIEAWGDRYLKLKNLRQRDWKEIANTVNSRHNGVKPQRSGVQCKNRVDTLKKKYKLEKAKPSPSKWPFYNRLCYIIGGTTPLMPLNTKSATTFTLTVESESNLDPNSNGVLGSGGSDESCDGDDDKVGLRRRQKKVELLEEETTLYRELARAILRFGEIYERIESAKQEQMMELEKQRLEFTKDLEIQRMNTFMEVQLQVEKLKRPSEDASRPGKPKLLYYENQGFLINLCAVGAEGLYFL